MKHPQVIHLPIDSGDLLADQYLVFDGDNVLRDSDQKRIGIEGIETSSIPVNIAFFDVTSGAITNATDLEIAYDTNIDMWKIQIDDDIKAALTENHKFVGRVTEVVGSSVGMRPFKLNEFVVERPSLEETWMMLPYQVEIGSPSMIVWYKDIYWDKPMYYAHVYEGGVGTTYASSPEKVTHRGPVVFVGND